MLVGTEKSSVGKQHRGTQEGRPFFAICETIISTFLLIQIEVEYAERSFSGDPFSGIHALANVKPSMPLWFPAMPKGTST